MITAAQTENLKRKIVRAMKRGAQSRERSDLRRARREREAAIARRVDYGPMPFNYGNGR